jgi:TRAP-type mannitol/chloroaromatic compound transport system permease small subunit
MIVAGYTLFHKAHVSVDILFAKFKQRTKAILDVITYSIFFFPFLLVVLYEGIKYAANSWKISETSWSAFAPPLYPIKTVIPITAALLLIQGISIFIRQIHMAIKGKEL